MIDFGFDKLALIGAVALIVIGPERLPRVAKTVGVLLGKAQRYVAQVQNEVSRSIELEELQKVKAGIEDTARNIGQSVGDGLKEAQSALNHQDEANYDSQYHQSAPYISYAAPVRKNWRLKRNAMPLWYKQNHGIRRHVQSGAARVARHRPQPIQPHR